MPFFTRRSAEVFFTPGDHKNSFASPSRALQKQNRALTRACLSIRPAMHLRMMIGDSLGKERRARACPANIKQTFRVRTVPGA